jgi:metallo-beta-lactamase class B
VKKAPGTQKWNFATLPEIKYLPVTVSKIIARMNRITKPVIALLVLAITLSCAVSKQRKFNAKQVYKSPDLIITQITANTFLHVSYKQTNDFGNVPCNGLVVRSGSETMVFDTPTNDKSAGELIKWIKETLKCKVNAVIPTHFHDDCLGGLNAFHAAGIPSYANAGTIALATANNLPVPQHSFTDSLRLSVGIETVTARFFGEGHTKDNVVGYFAGENVMFGGCLIKALKASRGFTGDANLDTWSGTVQKVKAAYPDVKVVVPGHGAYGDKRLLDYTIKLFEVK